MEREVKTQPRMFDNSPSIGRDSDEKLCTDDVSLVVNMAHSCLKLKITGNTFKFFLRDFLNHYHVLLSASPGKAEIFKKAIHVGIQSTISLISKGIITQEELYPEIPGFSYLHVFHMGIDEDSIEEKNAICWLLGAAPSLGLLACVIPMLSCVRGDINYELDITLKKVKMEISEENPPDIFKYLGTQNTRGNLEALCQKNLFSNLTFL